MKARLLIVDDEELIREIFGSELRKLGYEVSTASSAMEAEAFISQNQVDIMLLDLRMPQKTGIEFLREFKPHHPEIGVLIITAIDDVSIAVEAMKLGAYDYITKPLNMEELEIHLSKAYERWKLEKEKREYEQRLEEMVQERTEELRRRVTELEALNRMFQQHLSQRFATDERYTKLVKAVSDFIQTVQPLLEEKAEE